MTSKRASFVREDAHVRRQSLIGAAARCLAQKGASGTSVRAICREAGVSAGLLTHYFAGIDDLIIATYRDVGEQVNAATARAVEQAGSDPRAQLEAYITANFRPPVLDPELLATWVAFWSLVKTNDQIAAVHHETYADFRSGIEVLLRRCWADDAAADDIRLAGVAITALVDGLWLELCLDGRTFTPDEACDLALRWLDVLLSGPRKGPLSRAGGQLSTGR